MARTIREWYDIIVQEKQSQTALSDLAPGVDNAQTLLNDVNTPSRVADWRLWIWLVAFASHLLEVVTEAIRAETEAIAEAAKPHGLRWYHAEILKFQYGDDLIWDADNLTYRYAEIDESKRVVKQAKVVETATGSSGLIAKVKGDSGPLSNDEETAFKTYLNYIKDAGTKMFVINDDPDEFRVVLDVYYNPLVMRPNGSLINSPSTFPVLDAIQNHIDNLPFNGTLVLTTLVDSLQKAEGVDDPVLLQLSAKEAQQAVFTAVNVRYAPYSGHFTFDDVNSTINYIPHA